MAMEGFCNFITLRLFSRSVPHIIQCIIKGVCHICLVQSLIRPRQVHPYVIHFRCLDNPELSWVISLVLFHVRQRRKSFPAMWTLKRFLASVCSHVYFEVLFPSEIPWAHMTHKLFRTPVNRAVGVHFSSSPKFGSAYVTRKVFFVVVPYLVDFQGIFGRKTATAQIA